METGCLFLCLEVRKSNVFEAVKQAVPTRQAAEFYGVQVGRNGMACCPFHDDKHPSMKVDRRFHCFGCQADGDVIDFTARLFGLNKKEAASRVSVRCGRLKGRATGCRGSRSALPTAHGPAYAVCTGSGLETVS